MKHSASRDVFPSATARAVFPGPKLRPVDPRVRSALHGLAVRFARHGVRLFLFGSIARTWPFVRVGADFDLGYEMEARQAGFEAVRRRLEREVESLPSIRPVDLVDFSMVTDAFRAEAEKFTIELADEPDTPAAE